MDHPSHLMLRSKKEKSYTSTSPLDLHGLFEGEFISESVRVPVVRTEIRIEKFETGT